MMILINKVIVKHNNGVWSIHGKTTSIDIYGSVMCLNTKMEITSVVRYSSRLNSNSAVNGGSKAALSWNILNVSGMKWKICKFNPWNEWIIQKQIILTAVNINARIFCYER